MPTGHPNDPEYWKEWYEEQKRDPKFLPARAKYYREWRRKKTEKYKAIQKRNVDKRQVNGKSLAYSRKYYSNPENRKRRDRVEMERLNSKPWMKTRKNIFNRLYKANVLKLPHWKCYIGKKLTITSAEIKELWFRDKAYEMKQPSIDRIKSSGDYTKENCRYIEMPLNRQHSS